MDLMTLFMLLVLVVLIVVMIVQAKKRKQQSRAGAQPSPASSQELSKPKLSVKAYAGGYNGQIEFDGSAVAINRSGTVARKTFGHSGEHSIAVKDITDVAFTVATEDSNGFIHFETAATLAPSNVSEAGKNANSVLFAQGQNDQFEIMRNAVKSAVAKQML